MPLSTTYALDTTWRLLLKDLGVEPVDVLRRAGLPDDLLARDGGRLPAPAFHRFWDSLGATLGDPAFPLRLCRAMRCEAFSPALFAALCSPNLEVALNRIARYKPLVAPMRLQVRTDEHELTLTLSWQDGIKPPASLMVAEVLFFVTLARIGTREALVPRRVVMPAAPSGRGPEEAYQAFLGVGITQGAAPAVTFGRGDALLPFLTSNDAMWDSFEPALRIRLSELEASASLAQRVHGVLLEALPSGQATMGAVARRLATSQRTLQRGLAAEGQTFSRLLQATRQHLARHYLANTVLPPAEIALLLGFEEPNSFWRACRTWTGQTPEALRRQRTHPPSTSSSALASVARPD